MEQYNNPLIEDIFLSGFIETDGEIPIFKPMFWWCFLKLDNGKIIEISSNDGNIKLVEISKISSNFDLEEEDIFCIMSSTHCIQINATTSFDGLEILVM